MYCRAQRSFVILFSQWKGTERMDKAGRKAELNSLRQCIEHMLAHRAGKWLLIRTQFGREKACEHVFCGCVCVCVSIFVCLWVNRTSLTQPYNLQNHCNPTVVAFPWAECTKIQIHMWTQTQRILPETITQKATNILENISAVMQAHPDIWTHPPADTVQQHSCFRPWWMKAGKERQLFCCVLSLKAGR